MTEINITRDEPNINIDTATRTYHLPIASETTLGGIKVGNNLTIESDGTLNAEQTEYELPTASNSTLGGVKVGSHLSISDSVLSVAVDSSLSASSTNPVQNSVVNTAVSNLTSGLQTANGNISTLQTNLGTLSNTVSGHTTSISNISDTVSANTNAIETNTNNISNNTSAISDLSSAIDGLDSRLDTAEDAITDLNTATGEVSSDVMNLKLAIDETISYTYLLPVSSWSSGELTLHRRGNIAFLFANLAGSVLLGANDTTIIYTLTEATHIPLFTTSEPMVTDAGTVIMSVNDQGEVSLTNPSSSSITFTKLYGNVPLVY